MIDYQHFAKNSDIPLHSNDRLSTLWRVLPFCALSFHQPYDIQLTDGWCLNMVHIIYKKNKNVNMIKKTRKMGKCIAN